MTVFQASFAHYHAARGKDVPWIVRELVRMDSDHEDNDELVLASMIVVHLFSIGHLMQEQEFRHVATTELSALRRFGRDRYKEKT